jgi:ketosteroid isomerase-like protein
LQRELISSFFATFKRDWPGFRALWTDTPIMTMPFAPPGFNTEYVGTAFDAFWLPVFSALEGRFDWTIHRIEPLPGGQEVLVLASSRVDAQLAGNPLKYEGDYVQIFRFEGDRIAQLTEYFDSHRMGLAYGTLGRGD